MHTSVRSASAQGSLRRLSQKVHSVAADPAIRQLGDHLAASMGPHPVAKLLNPMLSASPQKKYQTTVSLIFRPLANENGVTFARNPLFFWLPDAVKSENWLCTLDL